MLMMNTVVCVVHSLISGVWALALIIDTPAMLQGTNVIHYVSPALLQLTVFSVSYFLYDCGEDPRHVAYCSHLGRE